jgi:hypothetical protein
MEIIFNEFIFAYSLAEYHNKVATSIFYFARTVIHATVQTDRLCYSISSQSSPTPSSTVADWKRFLQKISSDHG